MSSSLRSSGLRLWLQRVVPWAFYALLAVFLVLYLKHIDVSKLKDISINWWYIAAASLLGLGVRYFGAFIWLTILRTLGAANVRFQTDLIYVYAKAWMGRYIPGTAPWILGKIYFASRHGVSKQKLAIGSLLEGGIEIVTMLVLAFALLLSDKRLDVLSGNVKLAMLIVTAAGIIALVPRLFNRWFGLVYKTVRRRTLEAEHFATNRTVVQASALYLVNSLINGFSLFLIAKAIDPGLAYSNLLFVMGVSSLAGAAGMVAIFAPSGLGVREGIQLVLFALIMPKELAVAVTIATRLWIISVDVLFFGLSRTIAGKNNNIKTDS